MYLQLFATDEETGIREEITDLYCFESHGVRDWSSTWIGGPYRFEVLVDGVVVFDSTHPDARWTPLLPPGG